MKSSTASSVAFVLLFLTGAACGFAAATIYKSQPAEAKSEDTPAAPKNRDSARIDELEGQLAKARGELARLRKLNDDAEKAVKQALDETPDEKVEISFATTNVDFNAEMKKNMTDDQYSAATNAIASFRAKLAARAKGRIDFLSAVDSSRMSAEDRESHERFIDLMKQREELMPKDKGGLPDMNTIQQMMALQMEMAPLAKKERSILVNEVARDLGYQGDDAGVFNDTINNIYDCTHSGGLLGNLEDAMEVMGPQARGRGNPWRNR